MSGMRGVQVRTRVVRKVELACPRCGVDGEGSVVERQRWYCVVRVPVIPLATLDPKVVCHACGHHAGTGVLEVPTAAVLAGYLADAMRHAVVCVVRAGHHTSGATAASVIDARVIDAVVEVMIGAGYDYDERALARDLQLTDDAEVPARLGLLADELTAHGKQGFLQRMVAIAIADGALTRREQEALVRIGVGLRMAAPHINGVLAVAAAYFQAA